MIHVHVEIMYNYDQLSNNIWQILDLVFEDFNIIKIVFRFIEI